MILKSLKLLGLLGLTIALSTGASLEAAEAGQEKSLRAAPRAAQGQGPSLPNSGPVVYLGAPADLIVLPRYSGGTGKPMTGYCGGFTSGGAAKIHIRVKNVGGTAAPASWIAVIPHNGGGAYKFYVTALAPGEMANVEHGFLPWPTGAKELRFNLGADVHGEVDESREYNNKASGRCVMAK